jgi:hypothetical protein
MYFGEVLDFYAVFKIDVLGNYYEQIINLGVQPPATNIILSDFMWSKLKR